MKKKILGALIVTVVLFSGCSNKAAVTDSNKVNDGAKAISAEVKPIKAGTEPQLSAKQKEQINSNVNSTVKNIDDTLKSLDTPDDINVD